MIVYEGPSRIDGKPIVVILVGKTKNRKTGDMVQSYILRSDMNPTDALKTGDDESICGDCPHRGIATGTGVKGRSCYVTVFQGPYAVYSAYKRGAYPKFSKKKAMAMLGDRMLRLGTYGDPAAVPINVWDSLVKIAKSHTGYTHQWKDKSNAEYRRLCMASVDNELDIPLAKGMGYRYFRVRSKYDPVLPNEIQCPASEEMGKRLDCSRCGACWGAKPIGPQPVNVTIIAHGSKATSANAERTLISLGIKRHA